MKKTSLELKEHDFGKYTQRNPNESPKTLLETTKVKKPEKKNTIKTYNEFVRMVMNEENKERISDHSNNFGLNITPIKEKTSDKEK